MERILAYGPLVRQTMDRFIIEKRAGMSGSSPLSSELFNRLLPFASSGKLMRGSLVCWAYELFSGEPANHTAFRSAAAVELLHSALLIHDDIIDDDDFRRGQPSLHRQYRQVGINEHLKRPDAFGVNMALCGGDMALFAAFELLTGAEAEDIPPAVRQLFIEQSMIVCGGQMEDIHLEAQSGSPSKQSIYQLMEHKTASYSLALPLLMGASLAEAPADTLAVLHSFGIAAGIIFQIRDDELGMIGQSESTGKPVGSDIRSGKKTLLSHYLFEYCNDAERKKLKTLFGNPGLTASDIRYVQKLVQGHGILDALQQDVDQLRDQAETLIETLSLSGAAHRELRELVTFCSARNT